MLADQTHLVVSAGSKMQAHLFAWSSETQALRHLCKYNQQVFKKQQNMTGKKEFGPSHDVQDFRIMAAAVMQTAEGVLVTFGTSSGQLILEKLQFDDGKFSLRQVQFLQHNAAMLSMKRIRLPD